MEHALDLLMFLLPWEVNILTCCFFSTLSCSEASPQTPVRLHNSRWGKNPMFQTSQSIPSRRAEALVSLSGRLATFLSRRLNFRRLNILGNVWKLNRAREQRRVAGMKRCGETRGAVSYRRSARSHSSRDMYTHTHTSSTSWVYCFSQTVTSTFT